MAHNPSLTLVHQDDGTVFVLLEGVPAQDETLSFSRVDAAFFIRSEHREWVKENAPLSLWAAIQDERCHCLCCTTDQVVHTVAIRLD